MGKKIEDKIMDILNESVPYEVVGGPSPSQTLQHPLDYAKYVQKATVPQAFPIPGIGEIGTDKAEANGPITDVVDDLEEEEDDNVFDHHKDKKDDDDDDDSDDDEKHDIEETFASLLARLAEEEDEDDKDDDEEKDDVKEDETSLVDKGTAEPKVTLPDVDSELENPEALVTQAPGIQVAEDEEEEGAGAPKVTLPDVDSELENPEALATPAPGAKAPDGADSMKEDIAAIFSGVKLSEAAKAKAATIFKAAVARRVNEEKERVQHIATKKLREAFEILKARSEKKQHIQEQKLTGQVDRYLNYVVENWMSENRLAVERGIRAELAESFIDGLKTLFVEHYIEVPESKVNVVETLGKKVTTLESKLNEQIETNVKMRSSLNAYRKEEVLRAVSAGLADTQRESLKKLAEGVEYTTRKEYAKKLSEIREGYFAKKATPMKKEEAPLMESTKKPASDEMSLYTQTLSKMVKD